MIKTEVLIVGAGPGGAACAWQLQKAGRAVLMLDQASFPRQKPCAGWVTPSVFNALQISPDEYPFGLTRFSSFQIALRGFHFRLPTHQYAIRRMEFDSWLVKRAGIELIHHQVKQIEQHDQGYLMDGQYFGKFLVGAGGTHCPVRRTFFENKYPRNPNDLILAKEEEFNYSIRDNHCKLWFFENGLPGYAWYVPKSDGFLNIGIGGNAEKLKSKGARLQDYWEHLISKLDALGLVSGHKFQPQGYSYYLRQKSSPTRIENVLLVGDALGLATRDLGEGIGPAIQSGLLAADAICLNRDYKLTSIPHFSLSSILGLRS